MTPIVAAFMAAMVLTAAAGWMIFGSQRRVDGPTSRRQDAVAHEWRLASAEHKNIAEAVAACSGTTNFAALPASVREQLRLDILPDGAKRGEDDRKPSVFRETVALDSRSFAAEPRGETSLSLSNYARAAIYLSDEISRSRIESANNAYVNHWVMVGFQWVIVLIGALTTILISLKSIMTADGQQRAWSLRIGIAAILCSSIGTATSALNSFYGPRETYLKAERSLAALRQLHSDIAIQIGSIREPQGKKECPSFDPANKDDALYKQVQDWKTKLGVIVNASDSGSSYPSETSVPDPVSSSAPNP
jgi:hypothetical protein